LIPPPNSTFSVERHSDNAGVLARFRGGSVLSGPQLPQPPSTVYLVIAPNDSWIQAFANWKMAKGVPTHVANVTWIQSNFPIDGVNIRDKAEQIWNYIQQVYLSGLIPTLRWVLLVGDNVTIPSRYVHLPDTTEWPGFSNILKPTDFYYSVMGDSNWDDDNDGRWGECFTFNVTGTGLVTDEIGDWQPDLYVGRVPFSDQANITGILTKAVQYERNPTSYSATGWDTFLLAGAVSNYDEETWGWLDGDYTDEAELSDWINATIVPPYYDFYRFYEARTHFWNYSTTNAFQSLNNTAVASGINLFSPALVNFAGHGTPYDIQRKYDSFYPYGGPFGTPTVGANVNVTGVAIGDADNDGTNEIVTTLGTGPMGGAIGTIWMYETSNLGAPTLIWDLWNVPIFLPAWATCVDIGNVWNNGTIAVVVGTSHGCVIIFTCYNNQWITTVVIGPEATDPVLCIEVGNADNLYWPSGPAGSNTDIAWGHQSGMVFYATCFGGPPIQLFVVFIWNVAQAVYSIDVGNPKDDPWGEITLGTGYSGAGGLTGDCYLLQNVPPGPWVLFVVDKNLGAIVYGLDTGDAGNDGFNKVVVGLGDGAIYMYEGNRFAGPGGTDNGTKKTIAAPGANAGLVRCLRVGQVDENDLWSTATTEHISIVAGNQLGGIWKYYGSNVTGFVDRYPIQLETGVGPMATALYLGELSYTTAGVEVGINIEVVAGTDPDVAGISWLTWFEWPWHIWDNMISTTEASASTASIPALIYADSCFTGGYDYSKGSLAGAYLRNMAIGYIGAMRISWYYRGTMQDSLSWGLNRYMSYAFWQLFFAGTTGYRPGQTLYQAKTDYIATFQAVHTQRTWETYHRKNLLTYALFGDPEVDVFTANPATLTVTHQASYPHNQIAVVRVRGTGGIALTGAVVCLHDLGGSYYQVAFTNSTGDAVFNLTAPANTVLHLTVTNHNYSPYESTINVMQWVNVSGITLDYDSITLLLNVTGVMANCPVHGYLNNIMALSHSYTIYSDTTNITSGQLVWHVLSSTWRALNIICNYLPEGAYTVRCYFTDSDGIGWATSLPFTVTHHITISIPSLAYAVDGPPTHISIYNVVAICSYIPHGVLNDTEALVHTYTIYDNATHTATAIKGNLTLTGNAWQALDVAITTLPAGYYYVRCAFADSDVSATESPPSDIFYAGPSGRTWNFWDYLLAIAPFLVVIIIVLCVVIVLLLRRRRRIKPQRAQQRK
jgi:hypothetical protein